MFVIWSIEHEMWWKAGRCGYTRDLSLAGRYGEHEALQILRSANIVKVNEAMVPEACVQLDAGRLALNSVLGAIKEQSSLTDEDRQLLGAIDLAAADLVHGSMLAEFLHDYYGDLDRANRTPRALLYFHIGLLIGVASRGLE